MTDQEKQHTRRRENYEQALERCDGYAQTKNFLESIPLEDMTPRLAESIFMKDPELFYRIPDKFKDRELCDTAVRYDGSFLKYVPEAMKTRELCMKAIRRSPYAIQYIPASMKNAETYLHLVRENPRNLRGIPRANRTAEMCRIAFANTYGKDKTDYSVIAALTDPSMLYQVIHDQEDPRKIRLLTDIVHLNSELITPKVALEAVHKNGEVLNSIPHHSITAEVAEAAVMNWPEAIQWVPRKLRTPDICLRAETWQWELSAYVPDKIAKERNIYSFHRRVDELLRQPLDYHRYKMLYEGKPVYTECVWTCCGVIDYCEVNYNPNKNRLSLHPLTESAYRERKEQARTSEQTQRNDRNAALRRPAQQVQKKPKRGLKR